MCIILVKEKGIELPSDFKRKILECMEGNKQGSGFAFKRKNSKSIYISKGYWDYQKAMEAIDKLNITAEDEFMFHARISTAGKVDTANCHPFVVSDEKDTILFNNGYVQYPVMSHNGIFSDYSYRDSDYNDTYHYVKELVGIPYLRDMLIDMPEVLEKVIKSHTGICRVAFMFPGNTPMYLFNRDRFDEEEGILYSNTGHKYVKYTTPVVHYEYPTLQRNREISALNRELSYLTPIDRRTYTEVLFNRSCKNFEEAVSEMLKIHTMKGYWEYFISLANKYNWNSRENEHNQDTVARLRKYFQSIAELNIANKGTRLTHLLPSARVEKTAEESDLEYDKEIEKYENLPVKSEKMGANRIINVDIALTGQYIIKKKYGEYHLMSDLRLRIRKDGFNVMRFDPFKEYNIEFETNARGKVRAVLADFALGKLAKQKWADTILIPEEGNNRNLPTFSHWSIDYAFKTGIHIKPKCFESGHAIIGYKPIWINPLEVFNNFRVVYVAPARKPAEVDVPMVGQLLKWTNNSGSECKIVNYGTMGNPRGMICYVSGVVVSTNGDLDLIRNMIKNAVDSGHSISTMSKEGALLSTFKKAVTKAEDGSRVTTVRLPDKGESFLWQNADEARSSFKLTYDGTGYNLYKDRELQSTDHKTAMEHISRAIAYNYRIYRYKTVDFPQLVH